MAARIIRKAITTNSHTIQFSQGWDGSFACTLKMPRIALATPARCSLNCAVSHSSCLGIESLFGTHRLVQDSENHRGKRHQQPHDCGHWGNSQNVHYSI